MIMLERQDLMTLESYAAVRSEFKQAARQHRRNLQIELGDHITLCFEDQETVRYQIQEMLYIERTFDAQGIQHELDAYTPLIPTGTNFKATMMIEYSDPQMRKQKLQELVGIENRVWIRVEGNDAVFARADEDLDRATEFKTSAVHFLRWELDPRMREDLQDGAGLWVGVDHPQYERSHPVPDQQRDLLIRDLKK
jgi:hypothetical protein